MNQQIQCSPYLSYTFIIDQYFLALFPYHSSHDMFPFGLLIVYFFLEDGSVGVEPSFKLFNELVLL